MVNLCSFYNLVDSWVSAKLWVVSLSTESVGTMKKQVLQGKSFKSAQPEPSSIPQWNTKLFESNVHVCVQYSLSSRIKSCQFTTWDDFLFSFFQTTFSMHIINVTGFLVSKYAFPIKPATNFTKLCNASWNSNGFGSMIRTTHCSQSASRATCTTSNSEIRRYSFSHKAFHEVGYSGRFFSMTIFQRCPYGNGK